MATTTKRRTNANTEAKAEVEAEPVEENASVEAEGNGQVTQKRKGPTIVADFEEIDELPEKPRRGAAPGSSFGQSKWINILKKFVEAVPAAEDLDGDKGFRKIAVFENATGAGTARNNILKNVEKDGVTEDVKDKEGNVTGTKTYKSPLPDGVSMRFEARRVEIDGEDKSILFAKWIAA